MSEPPQSPLLGDEGPPHRGIAFLSAGLRPFFLAAGFTAAFGVAWWVGFLWGRLSLPTAWPPVWWHAHEMVFGFGTAAVSGFLLTAVPQWTDSRPLSGAPLGLLFLLWVCGRIVFLVGPTPLAVSLVDLAYLPTLTATLTLPMLRGGKRKNLVFPLLLTAMWIGNLLCHLEVHASIQGHMQRGMHLGTYGLVGMIAIVSGRIVPSYTRSALQQRGEPSEIQSSASVEWAAKVALFVTFAAAVLGADARFQGATALLSAALFALRMRHWHSFQTLRDPIVWILHAGHGFLALALLCKGIADLTELFPPTSAFHAFTAGTVGTMMIGIMTRASLGHTGRPLVLRPAITLAYCLVVFGALARIFGAPLAAGLYRETLLAGGAAWAAGYAIFTWVYLPILIAPRADGRSG
ncbi:MAG: NnrS family protein [Deltaproteobacteria bacterium]|nr:NnrS family protein [Deltaproteobacteria bacterium]